MIFTKYNIKWFVCFHHIAVKSIIGCNSNPSKIKWKILKTSLLPTLKMNERRLLPRRSVKVDADFYLGLLSANPRLFKVDRQAIISEDDQS